MKAAQSRDCFGLFRVLKLRGKMKTLLSAVSFVAALALGSNAYASTSAPGLVTNVIVSQTQQLVYFVQSDGRSTMPSCATNQAWVFSYSSLAGQGMLAAVLAAYSSGKSVYIVGTGDCGTLNGYEAINYITLP